LPLKATLMSCKKYKRAEFFGLSGSGKSTLYGQLPSEGTERYVRNKKHFLFWLKIAAVQTLKSKHPRLFRKKLGMLSELYRHREGKRCGEYIVTDEGWLQKILSFYEVKMTAKEVKVACNKIDMPERIIIVNRNPDDCFERFNNGLKNHYRLHLGSEYLKSWQDTFMHNFNLIKEYLKESQPTIITEATANSDVGVLLK